MAITELKTGDVRSKKGKITGLITEIKRFATHDGPGIRTTIFLKGCPLRCKWCSNPETWVSSQQIYFHAKRCKNSRECFKACPVGAIIEGEQRIDRQKCTLCMLCVDACGYGALQRVGIEYTPEEIVEEIAEDYPFYKSSGGGMTISGGEPLLFPDFTIEVMRLCKEKGIHTCLDTCGFAKPEVVKKVLKYTDLVLLDIKQMDPVKHTEWTGVSNELILKNAKLLASQCDTRICIPLVPEVNDSEDNIRKTAEFAKSIGVKNIDVEPFHKLGDGKYTALGLKSPYSDFESITDETVNRVIEIIESYGIKTTRGRNF